MNPRRLILLAEASSPHTARWAQTLTLRGWDVRVVSLRPGAIEGVEVHCGPRAWGPKIAYLAAVPSVKALIRHLRPAIVHAHYATSYGLLGALSGFRPLVVSTWGSDVFDFPRRGPIHRALLSWSLRAADALTATSEALAAETGKYAPGRDVSVVPFGVDLGAYRPEPETAEPAIGCLKHLERIYGQDVLMRAFALVRAARPDSPVRLRLAGSGSQRDALDRLAMDLGIADRVDFAGRIPTADIPAFMSGLAVFAMPSRAESFGVAAVEAAASGRPVVASRVGGLPEVVADGETGILVPPEDPARLAEALVTLLDDAVLRQRMGQAGRKLVETRYDWNANVSRMEEIYERVLAISSRQSS